MIDLEFVERLIRALDESRLDNLELERGGTRVRLSKSPNSAYSVSHDHGGGRSPSLMMPATQASGSGPSDLPSDAQGSTSGTSIAEAPEASLLEVKSPMVGTYYSAPAPDAPPYVQVGQRVEHGTILCIIEAMKLMNELESEVQGTIRKVMVENAQPVEYGQVLFLVDPS